MRRLVSAWSEDMGRADPVPAAMRILGKSTLARALEDRKVGIEIAGPFYYWITARAEPPLYEYVSAGTLAVGTIQYPLSRRE